MPSNRWTVCVECRKAWRGSPTCGHATMSMPPDWRVPRRRNRKAWRRLAQGDILTETATYDPVVYVGTMPSGRRWIRRAGPFPKHLSHG